MSEEQEQKAQERKVFKRGKIREKERNTSEIIKHVKEQMRKQQPSPVKESKEKLMGALANGIK